MARVDITNRRELNGLLDRLNENTKAQWGVMMPQHMVEHLAKIMRFTNGKEQAPQRTSDEEAQKAKRAFIYSDVEMPRGLKSPLLTQGPAVLEFADLTAAKRALNTELDDFESYFAKNPAATCVHPRLGSLTHEEWVTFHNKHVTHHFKQFGLL